MRGARGCPVAPFVSHTTPKYLHRRRCRWGKSPALGGRTKNFSCVLRIHGSPLQTSARRIKVTPDQSPTIVYLPGHRIHCIYVIPDGALNSEHTCSWQVYADGIFLSRSWRLRNKRRGGGLFPELHQKYFKEESRCGGDDARGDVEPWTQPCT